MWFLARQLGFVLAVGSLVSAQDRTARFTDLEHLDNDCVKLSKTGETLNFLATWIAPELKNYERVSDGSRRYIRTTDGQRVRQYPEKMTLRVSVGNKSKVEGTKPLELDTTYSAQELAKNLHFRLRVYDGLEYRQIEPASAKIIGVPADVPYDERIYLVEFLLDKIPVENRLMIEVLDPQNTRVTRFSISML
jgi:hypothetical protein